MGMLRDRAFDCLMTDLAMPNMSGRQIVEAVKAEFPNLPILVMSGRATSDPEVTSVMGLGCAGILTKPLPNSEDIVQTIKKAIATR
jgi:two-component system NtrC family response regulator